MMAKKKTPFPAKPVAQPASAPAGSGSGWFTSKAIREGIESLAIAFVLAFLFRTFEAEAFVIPTGSMAPTLMGQHKDLLCPECGYRYQAGASSEAEDMAQQAGGRQPQTVSEVACPLCRYSANVDPRTSVGSSHPTYPGDRILVSKFDYEFHQPQRWDVIVFKYPGGAETNYIKRLIGLPSESVRLWHGDVYIQAPGENEFHIERRDPEKLRAMAQIVYDNDYLAVPMQDKGWPARWQPWPAAQSEAAQTWTTSDNSKSYEIAGTSEQAQWIRYRHLVPTVRDWNTLRDGTLPAGYQPRPRLITDFCAYNTSTPREFPIEQPSLVGLHWVGDLILECELDSKNGEGIATLDLVKGGRHFRCEFDYATGKVRLAIDGQPDYQPTAQTAVRGKGTHHVAFANVDEQLVLWVDGSPIAFDTPTEYPPLGNDRPQSSEQDPGDLAPAGIGSQGAALGVSHIQLWRDIYYIAADGGTALTDYRPKATLHMTYEGLLDFFANPKLWAPAGGTSPFDERREVIFPLEADQFFVMGDNSPASADARLWGPEKFVSRELLIGKALMVFWPHSFNKIPGTPIPFPFFPNFARMGLIK